MVTIIYVSKGYFHCKTFSVCWDWWQDRGGGGDPITVYIHVPEALWCAVYKTRCTLTYQSRLDVNVSVDIQNNSIIGDL